MRCLEYARHNWIYWASVGKIIPTLYTQQMLWTRTRQPPNVKSALLTNITPSVNDDKMKKRARNQRFLALFVSFLIRCLRDESAQFYFKLCRGKMMQIDNNIKIIIDQYKEMVRIFASSFPDPCYIVVKQYWMNTS